LKDQLQADWKTPSRQSRLEWDRAQHAVRDAWDRLKVVHHRDRSADIDVSQQDRPIR